MSPCHAQQKTCSTQTWKWQTCFLNISISRAEHGALLNCLRLRLFMTAVPALLFSKHFCSRWVLTEQSGRSSAAGQEKTAGTAQLPKTATKQDQLCVLCFDYARSSDLWFKMLQLHSLTTPVLYGYLATAFSPAIKVISLMVNKSAHTHVYASVCHAHSSKSSKLSWSASC